jgi:hypothetical protein
MEGMASMRRAERPASFSSAIAAALFSAYLLSPSCIEAQHQLSREDPVVSSRWSRGACSFSRNSLTYSELSAHGSVRLDVAVSAPSRLICADDFTVILSDNQAVVSLGGRSVVAGAQMLGFVSGRFTPANSYSINISGPAAERISGASVTDGDLRLETVAGNSWRIDLSDPSEWRIY